MALINTTKIGKRGTFVIPAHLRKKYGFDEGSHLMVKELSEGILLQPVVTLPVEIYTPERKAEFLLNNAITLAEYTQAVQEVRAMGFNPEEIPHKRPQTNEN